MLVRTSCFGLGFSLLLVSSQALAQAAPQGSGSLPPLPPSGDAAPSGTAPAEPPPAQTGPAQPAQPPPSGVAVAPPEDEPAPTVVMVPVPAAYPGNPQDDDDEPSQKHAPKFSFYTNADLGLIGYGGYLFTNGANQPETSGNFAGAGLSFEVDVGARLGKRYIPYLVWEHAFLAPGHRFEGTNERAASDFLGLGFRLIAGNVDSVGFLTELGIGFRTMTIANDNETFKMTALEIARLGLGAEIRLSTLVTLTPIARLSIGQMSDSSGGITYAPNQGDGQTNVTFAGGQIAYAPKDYVVVGLGCGVGFDFFGK